MTQYNHSMCRSTLAALVLSLMVAGCANKNQSEMGQSLNQIMKRQIANPDVAMQQHEQAEGLDAAQGETILKTLRADVAQPKSVNKKIDISVGD